MRIGLWMVPLTPAPSANALTSSSYAANFTTTEGSQNQEAHFTPSLQELYTSELYNYDNIANDFHPIAKTPLMANLAIKSHGPMSVVTYCVMPVPTTTSSNSSSLHFSYEHVAFSILETSSQEELAKYHHQTVDSPPESTFLRSLWGNPSQWKTFPGLSYKLIGKHLPPSMSTYQGHMIRKQSCYNSTHRNRLRLINTRTDAQDMFPTEQVCAIT